MLSALIGTLCWSVAASAAGAVDPNIHLYSKIHLKHGEFSSEDLKLIEIAKAELERNRPDWTTYRVSVEEFDTDYLIEFWQPEHESRVGLPSNSKAPIIIPIHHRALFVSISKENLSVIGITNER
jgi:hypothetical protein